MHGAAAHPEPWQIRFAAKETAGCLQSIMTFAPSYKQLFDEQGYVIIPDLIPEASRKELEDAAEHAIARTRSGEWKHRRTVGIDY